jgi:hypothetical protein
MPALRAYIIAQFLNSLITRVWWNGGDGGVVGAPTGGTVAMAELSVLHKVGDRVAGNFIKYCGTCYYCLNGEEHSSVKTGASASTREWLSTSSGTNRRPGRSRTNFR